MPDMKYDINFIYALKNKIIDYLPGKNAQYLMAPTIRKYLKEMNYTDFKPVNCGVLLSLFYSNEKLCTTFIVRADDNHVHSGQIAFPGGRKEVEDTNIIDTALREAFEEVGIKPDEVEIVGQLTELYIHPSNYIVYPVIGFCNVAPDFKLDENEVKDILIVPLEELMDEKIKAIKTIQTSLGYEIEAPYYSIQGHVLWGATAMMVSEFIELVKSIE